ncbi:MAG: signal recognition particle protein, partial [Thermoleophilia bacterium]|nr:signal recognition particle protein [Thermoleophilia bacterium]
MFDTLQEKLEGTFRGLGSKGRVTEADIDAAMREIRLALLEADVNFKVVRTFVATVKERLAGAEVHKALDAPQQIVKVVNEELVALMGTGSSRLTFSQRGPTIILMAGLQGSGKTTTTAKLAKLLREQDGKTPALVACDVYRPAAIEQLKTVGAQVGVPVYSQGTDVDPVKIAEWGVKEATAGGADVIIVDTAGRLDIDEKLMAELVAIKRAIKPHNILLVLDAMTGQEAVSVATRFDETVAFDGVILTKLDGDARGGAALSVKSVTGKPIKFIALGEQLDALEYFHPDRMASRILGMGDVLSLIEKAEAAFEEDEAAEMEARLKKGQFTFDDFLKQMKMMRRMGSFKGILSMLPGIPKEIRNIDVDERQIARIEAIVLSMTK